MRVGKNNQCFTKITWSYGFESMKIVDPSRHGVAGVEESSRPSGETTSSATTIVYKPDKGYTGADSFKLHVSYFRGDAAARVRYESNLIFNVDVVDYHEAADAVDALKAAGAGAGVEITFSWDLVEKQVSPTPFVHINHFSSAFRLSADKKITFVAFRNGEKTDSLNGTVGSELQGDRGTVKADIVGGVIVITLDRPTYQIVSKIRSDGRTSCSATREYILKPGHQLFEDLGKNNVTYSSSEKHAENITCSISQQE